MNSDHLYIHNAIIEKQLNVIILLAQQNRYSMLLHYFAFSKPDEEKVRRDKIKNMQ